MSVNPLTALDDPPGAIELLRVHRRTSGRRRTPGDLAAADLLLEALGSEEAHRVVEESGTRALKAVCVAALSAQLHDSRQRCEGGSSTGVR